MFSCIGVGSFDLNTKETKGMNIKQCNYEYHQRVFERFNI